MARALATNMACYSGPVPYVGETGADYHGDQSAKELAPLTWASLSV